MCFLHRCNNKRALSRTDGKAIMSEGGRDGGDSKPIIFYCKRNIQTINTFNSRQGYSLYKQRERKPAGFISLSMFMDYFLVYETY